MQATRGTQNILSARGTYPFGTNLYTLSHLLI